MDGHGPMVIDNILVWLDRSVQYKRDSEQVFRYYHLTPIALITTLIDYFFFLAISRRGKLSGSNITQLSLSFC